MIIPLKVLSLVCMLLCLGSGNIKAQVQFDSIHVIQLTDSLFPGQRDAKILHLEVIIGGSNKDTVWARSIRARTNGTGRPSLIERASLYYQGFNPATNTPLDSVTLFGSRIVKPSGNFNFRDSIPLIQGKHYFLLCYDISSAAAPLDSFDAEVALVSVGGITKSPSSNAPFGHRTVAQNGESLYCSFSRTSTGNFQIGPTHVQLGNLLNAYSDNDSAFTFSSVPIPVVKDQTYELSVRAGPFYKENMRIWIDWDSDGYFENDERVHSVSGLEASERNQFDLKIPCGVSLGHKRMRILSDIHTQSLANACNDVSQGSGEDYILHVLKEEKPSVSFTKDTSIYEGSKTLLVNTTKAQGVDLRYSWDFDNNGSIDATDQDLLTPVGSAGQHPVKLTAILASCNGKRTFIDSFIDTLLVRSVGNRAPVVDFVASQNQLVVGEEVILNDLSTEGTIWRWSIQPEKSGLDSLYRYSSGTSYESKNPRLTFLAPGSYSVVSYVANKNGGDSVVKMNYLSVTDPFVLCGQSSIQQDTLTAPHGTIADNGGTDSLYSPFLNCNLLIQPICADEVHLDLNRIDISRFKLPGYDGDFLRVYDGTNEQGNALHDSIGFSDGIFSRNNSPSNLGRLTATSGSMYITFQTDTLGAGDGFLLEYSITNRSVPKPNASITAPDTVFVGHQTTLESSDKRSWVNHYWDFNNDGIPDQEGHSVSYEWRNAGTYRVNHIIDACGSRDTANVAIVAILPTAAPKADFQTTFRRVSTKDTIRLVDLSSNGPTDYRWEISGGTVVRFLNGTHSGSQNPEILIDSVGIYNVKLWVKNRLGEDSVTRNGYLVVRNYCEPYVITDLERLGISSIQIRDFEGRTLLSNASGDESGFSDYSDLGPVLLEQGATYHIQVERADTTSIIQRALWLDLNSDGRFDAGEKLLSEGPGKTKVWTDSFKVPKSSTLGLGRMRFATNAANQTDYGCGPHVTGEFEDYAFVISTDISPPKIQLSGGDTIRLNQCGVYTEPGFNTIDNVDGNLTSTTNVSGSIDENTPGLYELVYRAIDTKKNEGVVKRVVEITADTVAPEIFLKGNDTVFVEVFDDYVDAGYNLGDNCQSIDTHFVNSTVNISITDTYQVTITAIDDDGNKAEKVRTVIVQDTEAPVFDFLDNSDTLYLEGNDTYVETGWTVIDNYDTNPSVIISGSVNTAVLDTYYVSYSVTDAAKNGPTVYERVVIVQDTTPPTIALSTKTFEVEVGRKVNLPEPSYSDNFDPNPELFRIGAYDKDILGLSNIRYYAVDASGNTSETVILQVVVVDKEAPMVQLLDGPFITTCRWAAFNDPGLSLSDNYDPTNVLKVDTQLLNNLSQAVTRQEMVQNTGIYTLTYEVEDLSANRTTVSRTVQVIHCNLGLGEPSSASFAMYPVPATNDLTVRSSIGDPIEQIVVKDALGRTVLEQNGLRQNWSQLNVASLSEGWYILEVRQDGKIEAASFSILR